MKRIGISAFTGALAGYLYYTFYGCYSGTCPITSSPYTTTVYFAIMGLLVGVLFQKDKKRSEKEKEI